MGDSLIITLPLPPPELHPNARPHYMAKAAKTKRYRMDAYLVALHARREARHVLPWPSASVRVTRYAKTKRRADRDNVLASLKAAFDGIADAGVVLDDSQLTYLPVVMAVDATDPRVEIELTEGTHDR